MTKICFAASSGGHFEQIMMLKAIMKNYDSFIITEKNEYRLITDVDTYYILKINRKELLWPMKLFIVSLKSLCIFIKEKPDFIITTGALSTIPICIISKIFKKKVIFIESFAKVKSGTLTGKILYKFADEFIVQWQELKDIYPDSIFGGSIY